MSVEVLNQLIVSKERISDENNWCRGRFFLEGPDGKMRMCALGALSDDNLLYTSICAQAKLVLREACWQLHHSYNVSGINDMLGHKAVMELYDKAIELAKNNLEMMTIIEEIRAEVSVYRKAA